MEEDIEILEQALLNELYGHNTVIVNKQSLENIIEEFKFLKEANKKKDKYIRENVIRKVILKEEILNPMKEEHDKAIKGFLKRDIPQCIEGGGIAQVLGYFIGKIEELLEEE